LRQKWAPCRHESWDQSPFSMRSPPASLVAKASPISSGIPRGKASNLNLTLPTPREVERSDVAVAEQDSRSRNVPKAASLARASKFRLSLGPSNGRRAPGAAPTVSASARGGRRSSWDRLRHPIAKAWPVTVGPGISHPPNTAQNTATPQA